MITIVGIIDEIRICKELINCDIDSQHLKKNRVKIRPLTKNDRKFISEALFNAIHTPPGEGPLSPDIVDHPDLAGYTDGWPERPGDIGFILEEEGKPVAAAWVRLWPGNDHGFGFVD